MCSLHGPTRGWRSSRIAVLTEGQRQPRCLPLGKRRSKRAVTSNRLKHAAAWRGNIHRAEWKRDPGRR